MPSKILPSVMAQNQPDLNKLFDKLSGVAKELHLDVADGKFVPNTSLWFPVSLSREFKYNVHLMVKNPEEWIKNNGQKSDLIIVHFETIKNVAKFISWMKKKRKKIAFALKPETKIKEIEPYLKDTNYILILTVHPGFYGAKFLKSDLKKIKQIKKINPKIKVIVDGGMDPKTIKVANKAGADYFVSGSFVSKSDDPKKAIRMLRKAIS